MTPDKPFRFYLSTFGGKTKSVEEIVFFPRFKDDKYGNIHKSGYDYLSKLAGRLDRVKHRNLVERIDLVLSAANKMVPVVSCQCGEHIAIYTLIATDSSGTTISFAQSDRYGVECKNAGDEASGDLIGLKFSSIGAFQDNLREQKRFIQLLKFCMFGKWNVRMTDQTACNRLFKKAA
jgi:hypothetical protein